MRLTEGGHRRFRIRDIVALVAPAEKKEDMGDAPLGVPLRRQALIEIEKATRRVSIDEALAIAAALGVAPVHLLVPFEKEDVLNEDAAEAGIFEPDGKLKVGAGLVLNPMVARAWIRGTALPGRYGVPIDEQHRFYAVEVPPPVRHRLRRQAEYVIAHAKKTGKWVLPDPEPLEEERVPEFAVPGLRTPENRPGGLPAPLGTMLMFQHREEEGEL